MRDFVLIEVSGNTILLTIFRGSYVFFILLYTILRQECVMTVLQLVGGDGVGASGSSS